MIFRLSPLLLLLLTATSILNADSKAPGILQLSAAEIDEQEAKEYRNLSDEEKSRRCSGKYNQVECNKVKHCCYWEFNDPIYEEFQPVCMDFDIIKKFYIRNEGAYIAKIGQAPRHGFVDKDNMCHMFKFDTTFPRVRSCSCQYMYKKSLLGKFGVWILVLVLALA
jgi:hypothetical protein